MEKENENKEEEHIKELERFFLEAEKNPQEEKEGPYFYLYMDPRDGRYWRFSGDYGDY